MSRRGYRRRDTPISRALALFDTIGIYKRTVRTHVTLTTDGYVELERRAAEKGVPPASLGAYLIERAIRRTMRAI